MKELQPRAEVRPHGITLYNAHGNEVATCSSVLVPEASDLDADSASFSGELPAWGLTQNLSTITVQGEEMRDGSDNVVASNIHYDMRLPFAPETKVMKRIFEERVLDQAMEHFMRRNAEYGDGADNLGIRGQYADINRKVLKLQRYIWNGEQPAEGAEPVEVVVMELIGHLLLTLDMLYMQDEETTL